MKKHLKEYIGSKEWTPKELLKHFRRYKGGIVQLSYETNQHFKHGSLMSQAECNFLHDVTGGCITTTAEARELLKAVEKRGNYRSVVRYVVKLYQVNNMKVKDIPYDKINKLNKD